MSTTNTIDRRTLRTMSLAALRQIADGDTTAAFSEHSMRLVRAEIERRTR